MPRTRVARTVGAPGASGRPSALKMPRAAVVRDVVAADLVAALLQQRAVEELEQLLAAVVHGALREAFVVLVDVVLLLAEA